MNINHINQLAPKPGRFFVNALWMAAVAIAMGLAFDYFFYEKSLGVGFPIFVMLLLGVIVRLSWRLETEVRFASWELVGPLLFFAVMVFVRENTQLTVLNVLISAYLLILLLNSVWYPNIRRLRFLNYILPAMTLPFKWIGSFFLLFLDIVSLHEAGEHRKTLGQILRGVVITLPVIAALILLLSNVDPVIEEALHDVLNFTIEPEIIVRGLEVLLVSGMVLGMLGCISVKAKVDVQKPTETQTRSSHLGRLETTILLGSINAVFMIFFLLQISYLFGGAEYFQVQEITYASYAHKGFFELVVIAMICLAIIRAVEVFTQKVEARLPRAVNYLNALMAVQLLMLMLSAFQRLALYEEAYGFTVMRIFGHTIIIGMGIVLLLLLIKILYERTNNQFTFQVFATFIALMAVLNIINIEDMIVRQNMLRFDESAKLDTYYLTDLSSDAVPALIDAYETSDGQVREDFSDALDVKQYRLRSQSEDGPWQSIHLSRFLANRHLHGINFD